MASRLAELSGGDIEQIEQSRARSARRAERRELVTELSVALTLVLAAGALIVVFPPAGVSPILLVWLAALYAVLARIEFEVGEGRTHPIQLAFIPMLLMLPPALVPLAVAGAHCAAVLPKALLRRQPAQRLIVPLADSWFSVAPALVVAVAGRPHGVWSAAAVVAVAVAALIVSDLAVAALRMRVGLRIDPRAELKAFAWVYLADACLAPIGFLAAFAAERHPAILVGVLPLAGLLAVFARERRGRIENALSLQRLAVEGRDRLQSIVQNSSDLIAIVEPEGRLRTLTGSVEPIFGPDWQAAEGTDLRDHVHPHDVAGVDALLAAVATRASGAAQEAEWRMRYADGSHRHIAAVATNLLADEHVHGIVITARDVDERKAFEEQLRHRAFHDALTGLANRALFFDRVEHALARAAREGSRVAVLFLDLDDFKVANDAHGHALGDRLLQEVGRRLVACLRSADTAARLGGDEFGILLEDVGDAGDAFQTAARALDGLAQPLRMDDTRVSLSGSIGMAISDVDDRGVEEFLRKADLAMYEAKRNGKGGAELYEPGLEAAEGPHSDRSAWFARNDEQRAQIQEILDDPDGIRMAFQPIMDLRTGRVAGYESLARFDREPRRGPDVWIAQAHRCGLGYALEAKAIVAALSAPGRPPGTYLSVNLSPSSLLSEDVLRVLPVFLDGLVIEITENELVSDDPAITGALADLRGRGARLAVDDTGAGYAGLTHVMRLKPDLIKLDRALTTGVDADPAKARLISSFVRYARDIGATVCAEGVETLGELHALADLDVAYGQGYAIARPAPPWPAVATEAAAACLRSFQAALLEGADADPNGLERLAAQIAAATTPEQLHDCLGLLADQLHADEVRLVAGRGETVTQLLADDPAADPSTAAALRAGGYESRLAVPITSRGEPIGQLEACRREQRPWSRHEISRARIAASQLGLLIGSEGRAGLAARGWAAVGA